MISVSLVNRASSRTDRTVNIVSKALSKSTTLPRPGGWGWGEETLDMRETNLRIRKSAHLLVTFVCYVPTNSPALCFQHKEHKSTKLLGVWLYLRFWSNGDGEQLYGGTEGQLKTLCHRSSTAVQYNRLEISEGYCCAPNLVPVKRALEPDCLSSDACHYLVPAEPSAGGQASVDYQPVRAPLWASEASQGQRQWVSISAPHLPSTPIPSTGCAELTSNKQQVLAR